jgi:predicted nucleic acid-binding protein
MSKYLLDSNIIIDFLIGREEAINLLNEIRGTGDSPATSPLCIVEVQLGVKREEEKSTNIFLNSLQVYDLNRAIANKAGEYIREFRNKGITLPLVDTLIATTCIINNLVLVTYDTKHYSIPDLILWPFS